jgi:hypothetical protein
MDAAGAHGAALETHMQGRSRGAVLGVALLFLGTSPVVAGTTLSPSSFALARVAADPLGRVSSLQAIDAPALAMPIVLGLSTAPAPTNVSLAAVRYQPAQTESYESPVNDRPIVSQLHGGYFDASANNTNPFIVGLRAGAMVDKRLQVGIALDWVHQTKNLANVLSTAQGPGSITISTKQDTARALVNLVPIMAFVQASGWGLLGITPYIGASGGYEVLVLSADNFISGQSFEANFGGWGYQVWAGAGIPLGSRTKLNGELFVNEAELGKTVTDANGVSAKQTVDMNGIGFRLGLAWGYPPKRPQ